VNTVDDRCQFCVDKSDDHKYISLEFRKFPGNRVGVDAAGNMIPPKHVTPNSDETFFEIKLLVSIHRVYKNRNSQQLL
jgi:hypothetical protein